MMIQLRKRKGNLSTAVPLGMATQQTTHAGPASPARPLEIGNVDESQSIDNAFISTAARDRK
eukprot:COSAG01_NODE_60023_length_296_cov_59.395939_1_plen_61_part_10